ncbi:MLO 12 [Micractinium conductrix]|uniref:MLO 12 n=1 Tax=Micractinium conductrix TaxID=554055 RepID=A0A2P6VKM8_9CHLO|nr:MLO 12 [Micractinium conductrix]|eukprot:PSC74617.1 MLO 12 [Micractinium conductrix]
MAEGEEGLETSILETPTWVLAIVFTLFMVLSLMFEIVTHRVRHFFLRRGRPGMAEAWDKLVGELTLLGFLSLLLTAFAGPLGAMCVPYSASMAEWTLESTIPGCPCCLAETHGISLCAEMDHGCLFNASSHSPFCNCELTGSEEYMERGVEPYLESGLAKGDACMPFDSYKALYFLEISARSLNTVSEHLNVSRSDVCDFLGNETFADEGSLELLEEDLDWDPTAWEQVGRRRQRRRLSGAGRGAGTGAGEGAPRGRRRLSGGEGGGRAKEERVTVDPLRVMLGQDNSSGTTLHMLPRVKLFKCTGPFLSTNCPDGQVLLISPEALHQVHIWLFLVAICHVAVSVLQIALGKLRLRLWRRWEAQAQAEAASGRPNPLLASPSRVGYWHDWRGSSRSLFGHALEPPHEEDGGAGGRDAAPCAGAAAAAAAGSEGSAGSSEGGKPGDLEAAGDAPKSEAGLPAGAAGSCTGAATVQSRRGAGAAVKSSRERLSEWAGAVRLRWRFQPPQFTSVGHYLAEGLICFVQALSPNTVTRHNFMIMRAAWVASQRAPCAPPAGKEEGSAGGAAAETPGDDGGAAAAHAVSSEQRMQQGVGAGGSLAAPTPHAAHWHWLHYFGPCCGGPQLLKRYCAGDFVDHLLRSIEDDTPSFVGLSIEMAVVACVILLVSGVTGFTAPVFLEVSAGLLLATNITLVAVLRHSCRGGVPHGPAMRWWRSPRLLLSVPIRLILFLCSFMYASLAFFAWQFGGNSCFFETGPRGLPWWTLIFATSIMLLWVSAATIPTFSLVVHSHTVNAVEPSAHAGVSMLAAVIKGDAKPGPSGAPQSGGGRPVAGSVHAPAGGAQHNGGADGAAGQAEAALQAEVAQLRARVAHLEAALHPSAAGGSAAQTQTAAGALGRAAVNTVQDAVLETALESLTADSEEGLPDVTSVVEAAVADPKAAGDLVGEVAAGGAGLVATRAASHLLVQGVGQALAGTVGVPVRLLHSLADWLHFFLLDRLAATPLGAGAAATQGMSRCSSHARAAALSIALFLAAALLCPQPALAARQRRLHSLTAQASAPAPVAAPSPADDPCPLPVFCLVTP